VVNLPDWAAANVLNAPDSTLPVVVSWEPTSLGVGSIMDTLGVEEGAALLNTFEASSDPVMKWGLRVIEAGQLDVARVSTRTQIQALVSAGVLTSVQQESLFALSRRERYPSWAEVAGITVDPRVVSLARGGKP
jgi:hypothetical protein